MDYSRLTDEMLIEQVRDGNAEATEILMERYKNMVRKKANALFLAGGDKDDLNQEGMIGLFKAIRSYDEEKNDSFAAFASLCVDRQMYTAIESSQRKKNSPLNSYVSFSSEDGEEADWKMAMALQGTGNRNPEEIVIANESANLMMKSIEDSLSDKERKVFELTLDGMGYQQIAQELAMSPKSVDNTLQRIKKKIKKSESFR